MEMTNGPIRLFQLVTIASTGAVTTITTRAVTTS